ncbi:MAG: hypothetical protein ACKVRO_10315 [Micropepsaceae bacterium]
MTRTILLATTALVALTLPALADGKGGTRLTGLGDVGYDNVDIDPSFDQFHGTGSALWTWPNKWNVQGNFDFNTFQEGGEGFSNSKFGAGVFWRDANEGALGGELRYQTIEGTDGFDLRGRGELFLDHLTIGAFLGFGNYEDLDGWHLGAYGSYYLQSNLALNVTTKYSSWDDDGLTDFDDWSLSGEAEYLFADCDTSIYAGLGFGSLDGSGPGGSEDYWNIGGGIRLHFGTDGSLESRNRVEPLRTVRDHFFF